MIKQIRVAMIAVAVAGAGWYAIRYLSPVGASKDFSAICKAYDSAMEKIQAAQANGQEPNEAEIASETWMGIEKSIINKDAVNSMRAIAYDSHDDKFRYMQMAAEETGVKGWECESFRRYYERVTKPAEVQ